MPGTATAVWAAIDPVLTGSVYEGNYTGPPHDDGATASQMIWCSATDELVRRHPCLTAAVDVARPGGCTDLIVDVDDEGRLAFAWLGCLDLDDGLVGRPVAVVLPVLAARIGTLLQ